jgi:UDP-glucose 4-epimerase
MAATKRKVVVTGACGYVASLMLPQLREQYELVLLV